MHRDRAWWVLCGTLVAGVAAFWLRQNGTARVPWLPPCVFHEITGLHCAGCGMTRATHAMLHGRLDEAFRFNPVGMILLPLALIGAGIEILGWVRGRPLSFRLRVGKNGAWALVAVVIAFWILRNIPGWPSNLLAPP